MSVYVKLLIINILCVHTYDTLNMKSFFSSIYGIKNKKLILDEVDIKIDCAVRKCIRKCCPRDQYFVQEDDSYYCDYYEDDNYDFSNIPIYDDDDPEIRLNKKFRDTFFLVPGQFNETVNLGGHDVLFSEKAYDLFDSDTNTTMGVLTDVSS